jgi:hypothetical protein
VVISIASKRFTFDQPVRLITLGDNLTNVNWVANP